MHYQMLQVLSQKGRHIESYQHRMQHTLVNINIVTIAIIIITIISSSTCHSQMSWFQNTCSWSCFTSLFQSSFEAPTLPKSSFTNFRGKKKAKKVPVSLLPHKMATCLKQKKINSTHPTPSFLRVQSNLTIFQTIKNPKQVAQWPQALELVGIVRSQRTRIRLGVSSASTGDRGPRVLVDDYPCLGTNRIPKRSSSWICYLMTTPCKKALWDKGYIPKVSKIELDKTKR